jgi:hypothetical protein
MWKNRRIEDSKGPSRTCTNGLAAGGLRPPLERHVDLEIQAPFVPMRRLYFQIHVSLNRAKRGPASTGCFQNGNYFGKNYSRVAQPAGAPAPRPSRRAGREQAPSDLRIFDFSL